MRSIRLVAYSLMITTALATASHGQDSEIVLFVVPEDPGLNVERGGTNWADAYNGLRSALAGIKKMRADGNGTKVTLRLKVGEYYFYRPDDPDMEINPTIPGNSPETDAAFELPKDVSIVGGFDGETADSKANYQPGNPQPTLISAKRGKNKPQWWEFHFSTVVLIKEPGNYSIENVTIAHGRAAKTDVTEKLDQRNGGGIYAVKDAAVTLKNCLVTGNYAIEDGGGIFNAGSMTIDTCTIAGNTCGKDGGGVSTKDGGLTVIQNSIIAANASHVGSAVTDLSIPAATEGTHDVSGAIASDGFANSLFGCLPNRQEIQADVEMDANKFPGILFPLGESALDARFLKPAKLPLLKKHPGEGDWRLQRSSPAIDRGKIVGTATWDLCGRVRLAGPEIDIGAYEYPLGSRDKPLTFGKLFIRGTSPIEAFLLTQAVPAGSELDAVNDLAKCWGKVAELNTNDKEDDDVDAIWLEEGSYTVDTPLNLFGHLTVAGGFHNLDEAREVFAGTLRMDNRKGTESRLIGRPNCGCIAFVFNEVEVRIDRLMLRGGNPRTDEASSDAPLLESAKGGGLRVLQSGYGFTARVTLEQVCLHANDANAHGGGLWSNGAVTLNHCTIMANASSEGGGGISIQAEAVAAELNHTLVALNKVTMPTPDSALDDVEGLVSGRWNFVLRPAGGLTHGENGNLSGMPPEWVGGQLADGSPRLVHRLQAEADSTTSEFDLSPTRLSPVLEMGQPEKLELARDLRGRQRVQGNRIDIGAYEYPFEDAGSASASPLPVDNQRVDDLTEHLLVVPGDDVPTLAEALAQVKQRNCNEDPTDDIVEIRLATDEDHLIGKTDLAPYLAITSATPGKQAIISLTGEGPLFRAINAPGVVLRYVRLLGPRPIPPTPSEPPVPAPASATGVSVESTGQWPSALTMFRTELAYWLARAGEARNATAVNDGDDPKCALSQLNVVESELHDNLDLASNPSGGSALIVHGSTLTMSRSTLYKNDARAPDGAGDDVTTLGGAIHCSQSRLTIEKCTFVENQASHKGLGGALYLDSGSRAAIDSSTFAFNAAQQNAGAIYAKGAPTLSIEHSLICENTLPDVFVESMDDFTAPATPGSKLVQSLQDQNYTGQISHGAAPDARTDLPVLRQFAGLAPLRYYSPFGPVRLAPPLWEAGIVLPNPEPDDNPVLLRYYGAAARPQIIPYVQGQLPPDPGGASRAGMTVSIVDGATVLASTVADSDGVFVFRRIPWKEGLVVRAEELGLSAPIGGFVHADPYEVKLQGP